MFCHRIEFCFQFFGVDYRAMGIEWDRRTCIAGAATARYQGQAAVYAGLHHRGNFMLVIW